MFGLIFRGGPFDSYFEITCPGTWRLRIGKRPRSSRGCRGRQPLGFLRGNLGGLLVRRHGVDACPVLSFPYFRTCAARSARIPIGNLFRLLVPLDIPVEIRSHVGTALATGRAYEARLEIGKPHLVWPRIPADRNRAAALIVAAMIPPIDRARKSSSCRGAERRRLLRVVASPIIPPIECGEKAARHWGLTGGSFQAVDRLECSR